MFVIGECAPDYLYNWPILYVNNGQVDVCFTVDPTERSIGGLQNCMHMHVCTLYTTNAE